MGVALLAIALIAVSFYIGYRVGSRFIRQENSSLYRQVGYLQNVSKFWSEEATGRHQLSGQVAQQSTANLTATMASVIQLLHSIQHSQAQALSAEQHHKVNQLINQARSIAGHHERNK
ncbi:MAG TPA: hypothetical protein VGD89_14100 [Flavipsychrobacter sp.]